MNPSKPMIRVETCIYVHKSDNYVDTSFILKGFPLS
jgi:hypothetical protein